MEDRLAPRRTAWLGHDRGDRVDELGQAGDGDPVGVAQQGDQQTADDHRVGDAVTVLDQPWRPWPSRFRPVVLEPAEVPHVPLVERQVDALGGSELGAHVVGGRRDGVDEAIHVDRRGEEAAGITVVFLVVGVQRDVVDDVVGLLEDGRLP